MMMFICLSRSLYGNQMDPARPPASMYLVIHSMTCDIPVQSTLAWRGKVDGAVRFGLWMSEWTNIAVVGWMYLLKINRREEESLFCARKCSITRSSYDLLECDQVISRSSLVAQVTGDNQVHNSKNIDSPTMTLSLRCSLIHFPHDLSLSLAACHPGWVAFGGWVGSGSVNSARPHPLASFDAARWMNNARWRSMRPILWMAVRRSIAIVWVDPQIGAIIDHCSTGRQSSHKGRVLFCGLGDGRPLDWTGDDSRLVILTENYVRDRFAHLYT